MSISQNFPNTRPSLNLNFARSKTLDPRITFTRTSTGTYVDESGVIRNAVADEPRFDHDPVTGECLGLLIEEQRTNLTKNSNTLQSPFTPVNGTITTDQTTSPSGENNASLLTQTASTTCYVNYGSGQITWTSGKQYTFSCFVKKYSNSDENEIYILGYNLTFNSNPSGANSVVRFNLDTLTSTIADGLVNSHSIVDAGNGWRRISATFTAYTTGARDHQVLRFVDPGATSNMYVWGYQIEEGAFPTSYIPTTASSTVTRTKEYPTISGTDFTNFYNPSEGTFYVRYSMKGYYGVGGFNRIFEISDGGTTNRFSALLRGTNQDIYESGVWGIDFNTSLITFGDFYTYIMGYKENDFQRYAIDRNGNIDSNTDTSVEVSSFIPTELNIGYEAVNDNRQLDGHISQLLYYPTRLSNSQLQTLTK